MYIHFFTDGYNHVTHSIHGLHDVTHDDIIHYDDNHDYGLEASNAHSHYIDSSPEFYPNQQSLNLGQDTKFQPAYHGKNYNRGEFFLKHIMPLIILYPYFYVILMFVIKLYGYESVFYEMSFCTLFYCSSAIKVDRV